MNHTTRLTIITLLCAVPAIARGQNDQKLIEQTVADRQPAAAPAAKAQPAKPKPAPLVQPRGDEALARQQLARAQARLELVLARKALRSDDLTSAARHARAAIDAQAAVPGGDAFDSDRLQAEGILARAARAGITTGRAPVPDQMPAGSSAGRHWAYDHAGVAVSRARIDARNDARIRQGADVRYMAGSDELRRLVETDEARLAPEGYVEYPPDWSARVAARAEYEGGQIARTNSWYDPSGREWFTAVYDISDLTYVPPNFKGAPVLDIYTNTLRTLNLAALRERSEIFGGYAEDLAAGLPLLDYMGGLDDYALPGPRYSLQRQQEIVEMIRAATRHGTEPVIISQPAVGP